VNDQHVLTLVEAVHGAHGDTVHGFATNAAFIDDVGQLSLLPADRRDELIHIVRHRDARYLTENGRREDPRLLIGSDTLSMQVPSILRGESRTRLLQGTGGDDQGRARDCSQCAAHHDLPLQPPGWAW